MTLLFIQVSIILEEAELNEEEGGRTTAGSEDEVTYSFIERVDDGGDGSTSSTKRIRKKSHIPRYVTSDDEFDTDIEIEGNFIILT